MQNLQIHSDDSISNPLRGSAPATAAVLGGSLLVLLLSFCLSFAGNYPEPLTSKRDIQTANVDLEDIDIWKLPIEDFPLLSKFPKVKRVRFNSREGTFTTDDKLKALSQLSFTNLIDIGLLNCRRVTDEGIRALSKIRSLKMLQLEGTSITDGALEVMASEMRLSGVNVANCSGATLKGLKSLATSGSLRTIGFSADKLTQDDVLDLVGSFKNITWCEIVDSERRLDASAIKAKGAERKIHVVVQATGALQDMRNRTRDSK